MPDLRYYPNAIHVHVPWAECLLCRLDNPTYTDYVGRMRRGIDRVGESMGRLLIEGITPAITALGEFSTAVMAVAVTAADLRRQNLRLPSPLGIWRPGRFAPKE